MGGAFYISSSAADGALRHYIIAQQ